jgi:hypothetical protein
MIEASQFTMSKITRNDIPWRQLPHLRIEEAAEVAGVSRRTITSAIERESLEVRHIGCVPVISTIAFRLWIGEEEAGIDPHCDQPVDQLVRAKARRLLGKVG